jgi:hypothetical protein
MGAAIAGGALYTGLGLLHWQARALPRMRRYPLTASSFLPPEVAAKSAYHEGWRAVCDRRATPPQEKRPPGMTRESSPTRYSGRARAAVNIAAV